jgi:hypothetical protein
VYDADLVAADFCGVLKSESQHTLTSLAGDELDALDNAIDDDVFDARVLALGVLSN